MDPYQELISGQASAKLGALLTSERVKVDATLSSAITEATHARQWADEDDFSAAAAAIRNAIGDLTVVLDEIAERAHEQEFEQALEDGAGTPEPWEYDPETGRVIS